MREQSKQLELKQERILRNGAVQNARYF